jgi:acetylornithine deacetylase/succinyl-diaminopimelate desuccinylase-like protein
MNTGTEKVNLQNLKKYYKEHEQEMLRDYFTFLSFPSISSEPSFAPQVRDCANWLTNYLKEIGFDVEEWPTSGHPTLFATHLKAGPDQPTLLIYNHYDVQPTDPLSEWKSEPFKPTIRDGQVFARGAQDNKGQCFYTLQALKSILEREGKLPINIKLIIEGEEECGSSGIAGILKEKSSQLQADYLAIVDLGIPAPNKPAITLGVRGMVTMDVEVQGSKTDLHSGCQGGIVYNPLHGLVEILAALRDKSGKVSIPGFYDAVIPLNEKEKKQISWDFDEHGYEKMFGAKAIGGEKSFSPLERVWTRPTMEINGLSGGYSGTGFKTVIPAKAHAKISCRLVPDQDPQKIGKLVADFLEKQAPEGLNVKVHVHPGGGVAVRANPLSPVVQAFSQAYTEVYQAPCEFILEGASIPIIAKLAEASNGEVILVGLGLPDDQIHAPNEHFGLDRLQKGFLIMTRAIELLRKENV